MKPPGPDARLVSVEPPAAHGTAAERAETRTIRRRGVRLLLWSAGTLALGLGIAGIYLPVLPTTPFLIVAPAC